MQTDPSAGVLETRPPKRWLVSLLRLGLPVLLIVFWELGSRSGFIDRFYFSSPS